MTDVISKNHLFRRLTRCTHFSREGIDVKVDTDGTVHLGTHADFEAIMVGHHERPGLQVCTDYVRLMKGTTEVWRGTAAQLVGAVEDLDKLKRAIRIARGT